MLEEIREFVCLGLIASLALTARACGTGSPNGGNVGNVARRKAPDAQIVFEAPGVPGEGNIQEIFTMNLDGSNLKQITKDGLRRVLPTSSPTGRNWSTPSSWWEDIAARTPRPMWRSMTSRAGKKFTHTGKTF
jgi:hypothetical protein